LQADSVERQLETYMDEESKIMISTSKISIKKGLNCG